MTALLPQSFLRRMDAKDRGSLGKAGMTTPEVDKAVEFRAEKALHGLISQELNRRGIKFIRADMRKRSTLPEGHPDYTCFLPRGRTLFAEIKTATGKLSAIQERYIAELKDDGHEVWVVRSFEEFKRLLVEDELR